MGSFFSKETDSVEVLPETKDECRAIDDKLVYWNNGTCNKVDDDLVTKLNNCNKTGHMFDFTTGKCASNTDYVPRCDSGKYWYEPDGEVGGCKDLPKCTTNSNVKNVSLEGFEGKTDTFFSFFIIFLVLLILRKSSCKLVKKI